MKHTTHYILIGTLLLLTACGGRTPAPVMVSQYGDHQKSCQALESEMFQIQGELDKLLPKKDKTGKNVALGVTGAFFLVPLFFMDFKNAEATEYEAYRQRYAHLVNIADSKECGIAHQQYPTIEELKKQSEQASKKK